MSAAYPDVVVKDLTDSHEFLVLACDGIWDVLTNEEVVEFVRKRIAQKMQPEMVSFHLSTSGQREKVCPGCISETVRCRKLILGRDIG